MSQQSDRILLLMSQSANDIIEHAKNTLTSNFEDGEEITRNEINSLIEMGIESYLIEREWYLQEALRIAIEKEICIDDLLKEYSHDE